MREIKFRAWLVEEKTMYPWHSEFFYDTSPVTSYSGSLEENENVLLMQYTGLKDKNGVEVYEGDILKDECGFYGVVKYGSHTDSDMREELTGFYIQVDDNQWHLGANCDYKVAGNIYENPELLES